MTRDQRKAKTSAVNLRWRDYETPGGKRPVKEFINGLADEDAAAVVAAMKDVQLEGSASLAHLRGPIYEVRAFGNKQVFRVLFAQEGRKGRILLALDAISKKTQKTPDNVIALATRRLSEWRRRGQNPGR